MKTEIHIVSRQEEGQRLDVFLSKEYTDLSRSWIQKLIKATHVKINGGAAQAKTLVSENDEVSVDLIEQQKISLEPEIISPEPTIVFENNYFLVLEKPAGLVIHPSGSTPSGTLVNWLIGKYPQIKNVGEDELRPGIVHRLDKETSGLMIVSKTNESFTYFKRKFQERKITKTYAALVKGHMAEEHGTITFAIYRDSKNPFKRRAIKEPHPIREGAREAETYWSLERSFKEFSLLKVIPKSGRMHQIRVHLAAAGHPIVGDTLYKGPSIKGMARMFLHASGLQFKGPDGDEYEFNSPLPTELNQLILELEE